jgi:hypothetical protein
LTKSVNLESEKAQIRQALLLLKEHSDYQILRYLCRYNEQGLLAENSKNCFCYEPNYIFDGVDGAIYLKFNSIAKLCYFEESCQASRVFFGFFPNLP